MPRAATTVFIVDDDASVLKSLSRLLRSVKLHAVTFTSPAEFLDCFDPGAPGCLVLDVAMPGIDGLQLHQMLLAKGSELPVIFLTGQGDIPTTVRAMKSGAVDFLTKPINDEDLFAAIRLALEADRLRRRERVELERTRQLLASLTPREHEVLEHLVTGQLNKQIAADLGIVEKTIKVHRGRVMKKLGVRSVVELLRLAEGAGMGRLRRTGSRTGEPPAVHS